VCAVLTQENAFDLHNQWWVTGHKHGTVNFPQPKTLPRSTSNSTFS